MVAARKTLFILTDQFRADLIHGALAAHIELPNIRAFQQEAVTFTNNFSVVNPCGPSRASILTGMYAFNHRSVRNGTPLSACKNNLALELRKAGIEPLLFGYTDTSHDPRGKDPDDPVLRSYEEVLPGFTEVVEMRQDSGSFPWREHLRKKGFAPPEYIDFYRPVSPDPDRPARPDDPAPYGAEDSDTAFLTDRFLEHMQGRTNEDWFALLTYIRPHPPLVAPAPYNRMYRPETLPLPSRMDGIQAEEAVHPFIRAQRRRSPIERQVIGCEGQLDERRDEDVRLLRALYFGLASEVDFHIGRVLRFLKDSGQWDETQVVFMADHGEMLGDHHAWGKEQIYDPAFRTPLIIRDPAHPQHHGNVVTDFSESIDIAPTILDQLSLSPAPGMDGRSLGPFLRGKSPPDWREHVHMELDFGEPGTPTRSQTALGLPLNECNLAILRDARFKLVFFSADLPSLLFDMRDDPLEMRNLADDPAHAQILQDMIARLLRHRMKHAEHSLSGMKITPDGVFGYTP